MAWCLLPSEINEFTKALKNGDIDPTKLQNLDSTQRRNLFSKFTSEENAQNINSLFESKLLLKNQRLGMVRWAQRVLTPNPTIRRDMVNKINRLSEKDLLNPSDLKAFKEDLVRSRLGLNITFEEAKNINQLSQSRVESRDVWESEIKKNPKWLEDPQATRKEWIHNDKRIVYGAKEVVLENYVNDLKNKALKVSFKEHPLLATQDFFGKTPGLFKSLASTFDDSFFGRQGIPALFGTPKQKRIWFRNFSKSFTDIHRSLRASKINNLEVMDLIRADVYSRPNAMNGKYKAGGYKLDVLSEEAFPSQLPGKIPGLRRAYLAFESAFNGGAIRMRADLADLHIQQMEKEGLNTLDPAQAKGVGNMIGSLTGRGNLGKAEVYGRELNVLLFSARFFKANFDKITAHQFDPSATPYVKKQARISLASTIAHVGGLMLLASLLDPDSVDFDPRSTNFGRIKIFGKWTDITGGMRIIPVMVARMMPTKRNGVWGVWQKSSTGNWTNLTAGEFGAPDAISVFMDALLLNKLSPFMGIVRNYYKGEMFGGQPFNIKQSIINSTIPISIQNVNDIKDDGYASILAVSISEFFGLGVSTYKYNDSWERKTSQEMKDFKKQVGEEKFRKANDDYNRAYNIWFEQVQKDANYKKLSDDGRSDYISKGKEALKKKILIEYGYTKISHDDTEQEKEDKRLMIKIHQNIGK